MKLSNYNKSVIIAYQRGYRVLKNGKVKRNGKIVNAHKRIRNGHSRLFFAIRVTTKDNSRVRLVLIHKLQAYQKYGYKMFRKGIQVRHRNGCSENNSYKNILIGTAHQNMMDIPKYKRIEKAIRASSFMKKYNHAKIIALHKRGLSYNKIMKRLNITSKGTISFIINESIQAKK